MLISDLKKNLYSWLHKFNQPILLNEEKTETLSLPQNGGRDKTFDVLKGIAIILMILGHCYVGPLRAFIFSFHMPLFFFVTGYFLKIRPLHIEIGINLKRLIVPYVFSVFCILIIMSIQNFANKGWIDTLYIKDTSLRFLLGFKGNSAPEWLHGEIRALWFLLALFWAKAIVVFLINTIKSIPVLCIITLILSLWGAFCGEHFFMPFSIPLGVSATGFVYAGFLIRKHNLLNSATIKTFFPVLLILWLYSWTRDGMDIALFRYPTGYIFGLLGAFGAFYSLYKFVQYFFNKESIFWKFILWGGRYSIVIYCCHAIDENTVNWRILAQHLHISLEYFDFFQIISRITITFFIAFMVLKIKFIRKCIFQIKKS